MHVAIPLFPVLKYSIEIIIIVILCAEPCSNGDVQLIGDSRYNNFGRVEVCINESWGKVCSNMWENNDASVVCRQLGFSPYGMPNGI